MSRAFAALSHSSPAEHGFDAMPHLRHAARVAGRLILFTAVSGLSVAAVIAVRIVAYWH